MPVGVRDEDGLPGRLLIQGDSAVAGQPEPGQPRAGDRCAAAKRALGPLVLSTPGRKAPSLPWDCRKIGGAPASWILLRLFSDQGWMRGLDFEVGENRG